MGVRSSPISGHLMRPPGCPLWVRSGHGKRRRACPLLTQSGHFDLVCTVELRTQAGRPRPLQIYGFTPWIRCTQKRLKTNDLIATSGVCAPRCHARARNEVRSGGFLVRKTSAEGILALLDRADRPEGPDILRRLEREVGPLADAALSPARPHSVLWRAVLRTAIAGMAMAVLVIASQYLPNEIQQIETTGTNGRDREVAQLRAALDNSEAAQRSLQQELDLARNELRSRETRQPLGWHEDSNLLLYRSPRWGR